MNHFKRRVQNVHSAYFPLILAESFKCVFFCILLLYYYYYYYVITLDYFIVDVSKLNDVILTYAYFDYTIYKNTYMIYDYDYRYYYYDLILIRY